MGLVDKNFLKAFGKPSRKVPNAVQFTSSGSSSFWQLVSPVIGAGWYRSNFLYLFGDGLEPLRECLDAWSFIVPKNEDRVILGRNAYGAILTIENESKDIGGQSAGVIDPVTVQWWNDPNSSITNLIGNFMPNHNLTPKFFDESLFTKWSQKGTELDVRDILALTTPVSLGGKLALSNARQEDIVEYYTSTAPIYKKAFASLKKKQ